MLVMVMVWAGWGGGFTKWKGRGRLPNPIQLPAPPPPMSSARHGSLGASVLSLQPPRRPSFLPAMPLHPTPMSNPQRPSTAHSSLQHQSPTPTFKTSPTHAGHTSLGALVLSILDAQAASGGPPSAAGLVEELAEAVPGFDDKSEFKGKQVGLGWLVVFS